MSRVAISSPRFAAFVQLLKGLKIPAEQESSTHSFAWKGTSDALANCYLAIVAICHQTSPIGERRLEGTIDNIPKVGWDYLKEKYLRAASEKPEWSTPAFLSEIDPVVLSELYFDQKLGHTLNRINERAFLLNDVGKTLIDASCSTISQVFANARGRFAGEQGFNAFLKRMIAFQDPVMKKSLFFLSLAINECKWQLHDAEGLQSPVDYHEIRGHLRIGTIDILDAYLRDKVYRGMVLTAEEDVEIRQAIQEVNDRAARSLGITSSVMHYLCWNIFRNCCPRDPSKTHCATCGSECKLPQQYKTMVSQQTRCVFSQCCSSAGLAKKPIDPPLIGHYY